MEPIYTKIVGVTFNNDDGSSRQDIIASLSVGDELRLVDCGSDRFPEAIGVFNEFDEQCGHISKELAQSLRNTGEDFESFIVTVEDITGGNGRSYGCNICISESNSLRLSVSPQLLQAVQAASVPAEEQPSPEVKAKPASAPSPIQTPVDESAYSFPTPPPRRRKKGCAYYFGWAVFIVVLVPFAFLFFIGILSIFVN